MCRYISRTDHNTIYQFPGLFTNLSNISSSLYISMCFISTKPATTWPFLPCSPSSSICPDGSRWCEQQCQNPAVDTNAWKNKTLLHELRGKYTPDGDGRTDLNQLPPGDDKLWQARDEEMQKSKRLIFSKTISTPDFTGNSIIFYAHEQAICTRYIMQSVNSVLHYLLVFCRDFSPLSSSLKSES